MAAALAVAGLGGCRGPLASSAGASVAGLSGRDLSDTRLYALTARLPTGVRSIARRHDPGLRRPDPWGRPTGWSSLDLRVAPDVGVSIADRDAALAINGLRPFSTLPIRPMRPFVLTADAENRAQAVHCMTQAIYYEAAREPQTGQEAVAQVVLNRLRHPAYPKSVCGVVYQGGGLTTGCQFTFTCDGSLRAAPQPALWRRAQDVATRALSGYVDKTVGSATHYHAAYVWPYWAPTLVKMVQVGQHIFYRWTGPWGEPPAFQGRYAGGEADLSPALLASVDPRTQGLIAPPNRPAERQITLAVAGEVRSYTVLDPGSPAAPGTGPNRTTGTIYAIRRQPTADEIRRINDSLAVMERNQAGSATAGGPNSE